MSLSPMQVLSTTRHIFSPTSTITRLLSNIMSRKLYLFDVDGTLTEPRKQVTKEMHNFLKTSVAPKVAVALVGGSDYNKISEQMQLDKDSTFYHAIYSENGLVAHRQGREIYRKNIQSQMGEDKLQAFINFALRYMSNLTLPVKRGTFIEFRTGLINVCPVGRSCSQSERDAFEIYDKEHKIREKFVATLRDEFPDLGLVYAIGGQISFDVFPDGWDKTYCLQHISAGEFDEIHFFGDKTDPGGNDHELFSHRRVQGHKVINFQDTMNQIKQLLSIADSE